MDTKILQEIGLTNGEIKTYLALLKIGESSTGPIAKESGVSRSKLYIILDKLEKKGLVSHIEKEGVTYFQAVEPSKIKEYIDTKQEDLKKLKHDFEDFLPQLDAFYNETQKVQSVRVYQGFKGLMTAHEHTYQKLKRGEEYVYMGIPKFQPEEQHLYWQRDHLRRNKLGIKTKLLFNKDTHKNVLINRNSYKGCDARYMPTDIKTPSSFLIYKDTVMISMPIHNPITIEIINQDIADSFMAYFYEFWNKAVPFKS